MKPGIGTVVSEPRAENATRRNDVLKNVVLKKDLERVVVDAKLVGLRLEDLTAVLAYHWDRLSPGRR